MATKNYPAPYQAIVGSLPERAGIEKRLESISGHDGTKASIRYPWVLADTVNSGHRQLTAADFGIPFVPQPVPYDFVKGARESLRLLAALEAGKDPLWQARGDS